MNCERRCARGRLIALKPDFLLEDPPAPPRTGAAVLVRGDNIEDICDATAVPEDARAIELPGATLMPGLIDAHVHLALSGCETPRQTMMQEDDQLLLLRAAENARAALMAGITTLRDCGDRGHVTFALRRAIDRGITIGPRLVVSGAPLTSPRGHCYFMGGEVEGRAHIAKTIAARAHAGADFIKMMATGGGLTPGTDSLAVQFPSEDLTFAILEARKHGLYVAAHAHNAESIRECAEAGVRTIEHCTFAGHGKVEAEARAVQIMAERGAVAVPTAIPAVLAVRKGRTLGIARQIELTPEQFLEGRRTVLRELVRNGVPVIAGTDAGATGVPFCALAEEIEWMGQACGNALEALAAATARSADVLGLAGAGRIRKGFWADLLAVAGNPAEDLSALGRIRLVMSRGAIVRMERE
jgi:imidazolonepropionase-like amidohydrolase